MMKKRFVSLWLALVLVFSMMPLAAAFAEGGMESGIDIEEGRDGSDEVVDELPEDFFEVIDPVDEKTFEAPVETGAVAPEAEADTPAQAADAATSNTLEAVPGGAVDNEAAILELMGHAYGAVSNAASNAAIKHSVKITEKDYKVTIKGSVPSGYVLGGVIVDDKFVSQDIFGKSINYRINMNDGSFATGYHTVVVGIYKKDADGSMAYADLVMQKKMASNLITDKPTYKGKFEVYHNYFDLYPFDLTRNQAGTLYLEYSSNGGKTWKRSGSMTAGWIKLKTEQGFKISGLKAKKKYRTRLRYGEYVTYSEAYSGDGKSYFFGGPALKTATIITGSSKKPSIRSVKAEATNVQYHENKIPGHYEWVGDVLIWVDAWTERYYTCNVRVTVRLKKKPGTKGMWITFYDGFSQTKWVKGNKKTYTATFKPYPNYFSKHPKGNFSYKIKVRSGQGKKWGGYSPAWSGTRKLS